MKTTLIKFFILAGFLMIGENASILAKNGSASFRIKVPEIKSCENECDEEINYINLYSEILKQGIEFPDIVWSQAVLESGHFKSKVYKENNNFFGMRMPAIRSTVAVGKKNGYAIYKSWKDCVRDYKLYQDYIFSKRAYTRDSYFLHLNKTYSAGGSSYSIKLKQIIKTIDRRVGDAKNEDKTDPKKERKPIDPIILNKKDQEDCDD